MSIKYNASAFLGMINDGYKYTTTYQKRVRETNTNVEELETKLTDLRKSVRDLNSYNSNKVTNDKLGKQLEEFVETYNEIKDGTEGIEDKRLSKSLKKMEALMEEHKKEMKKLGIRENTSGEIIFDEEKFKDVEQKDIDKLLEGKDSFIRNIFKLTKTIQKQAEEARYSFVNRCFHSQAPFASDKVALAKNALDLTVGVTKCENGKTLIESGTLTDEQKINIHSNLNSFASTYNTLINSVPNDTNIKKLIEETAEYKDELSTIGITIDESSNNFKYTETDTMGTEAYKTAYSALFGESTDSYGNILPQYAAKIYTSALDTESHGIIIDMAL